VKKHSKLKKGRKETSSLPMLRLDFLWLVARWVALCPNFYEKPLGHSARQPSGGPRRQVSSIFDKSFPCFSSLTNACRATRFMFCMRKTKKRSAYLQDANDLFREFISIFISLDCFGFYNL
jgi:hypothetical protein